MTISDYVLPTLLLLGVLVVIHELGHFLVAKYFNVKCERFSVGFGPPLLRYKYGETEYMLAWLPLGGYVKMLGESPDEELAPEELARSFSAQSPLRRTLIAFAGPAANLLLSIVVLAAVLMTYGFQVQTARIGSVEAGSPAWQAGVLPGDRVTELDGEPIADFGDLVAVMAGANGSPMSLAVDRDGRALQLQITPEKREANYYLGVRHRHSDALLALPSEETPAFLAGLRTGDRIVAVNGQPVLDEFAFQAALADSAGPSLALEVERARGAGDPERVAVTLEDGGEGVWSRERMGAVPIDYAILATFISSAATSAGLEPGDLPLRIDGQTVTSAAEVETLVQASGGKPLAIDVLRRGEIVSLSAEPRSASVPGPDGALVEAWRLGLELGAPEWPGEVRVERESNPLLALKLGVISTFDILKQTLAGFYGLFTRKIGLENLAGPIGIGAIAGETFKSSSIDFLRILCLISVNLAVINLLPIPILDGGHIIFAAAEAVRGSPVGLRAREIAQTVGLSLILLLMGFAFWNDLSRHWSGFVKYFQNLL